MVNATASQNSLQAGAWSPLKIGMFRSLWLAILASNIGTWVNDVAAAWVMAERTGSPLMVALVQSATTVPIVLLALAAGTLADIVDRRRYLIVTQGWMLLVALVMAVLTHLQMLSPELLVLLTFCMGCGAAMAMPAQAAIVSELVPQPMLASAVALNSIGINIARSIGPAIGGVIVSQLGAMYAFAFNAITFAAMLVVVWAWKRDATASSLPPEGFGAGLKAGIRYATKAGKLQAVLIKSVGFFFFAAAANALLPVVVRGQMHGGAGQYGMLLGCIGIGAVGGALLLPKLRAKLDRDMLVLLATLALAGSLVGLALLRSWYLLPPVMMINGFAWITVLSSLQIAAQTSVPAWVRARALALYIMIFSAGMAAGGLSWGALAQQTSPELALLVAAIGAAVGGLLVWRVRIAGTEELNLRPAGHWPAPELSVAVSHDRGPVLVTLEYRIDNADRAAFHTHMHQLGIIRRRDGAVVWGVVEDVASPGIHLEYFVAASWLEHLRQHERITADDKLIQEALRALHKGERAPVVRHFVGGGEAPVAPLAHHHQDI